MKSRSQGVLKTLMLTPLVGENKAGNDPTEPEFASKRFQQPVPGFLLEDFQHFVKVAMCIVGKWKCFQHFIKVAMCIVGKWKCLPGQLGKL